ncbi:MAG: pseudaminic acid synthase [Clostridium sp.]|nr:pseudaminic acid synthase [Clostridium sp.]
MNKEIIIGTHRISEKSPTYIVAEISANHNMDYDRAVELIRLAADAGADAVKIQTYTPDTITIDCDNKYFQINQGTIWDGTTLYKLYQTAYTPWEWQDGLKQVAKDSGVDFFSSPFDLSAVDFLEQLNVDAYKIASFEINDIPLIRKVAKLSRPIIISTGIARLSDIELALQVCQEEKNHNVILLKCTSAYPAPYEDMNLKTIQHMAETFDCIVGLSDHSMGWAVDVAAVALGAKVIEKHITIKRSDGGPDSEFSMEATEFSEMCKQIRITEKAIGGISYELSPMQLKEREFARSLFVVKDIKRGEIISSDNVKSIRPAFGMHTKHYEDVLGCVATKDIKKGTPLTWELVRKEI